MSPTPWIGCDRSVIATRAFLTYSFTTWICAKRDANLSKTRLKRVFQSKNILAAIAVVLLLGSAAYGQWYVGPRAVYYPAAPGLCLSRRRSMPIACRSMPIACRSPRLPTLPMLRSFRRRSSLPGRLVRVTRSRRPQQSVHPRTSRCGMSSGRWCRKRSSDENSCGHPERSEESRGGVTPRRCPSRLRTEQGYPASGDRFIESTFSGILRYEHLYLADRRSLRFSIGGGGMVVGRRRGRRRGTQARGRRSEGFHRPRSSRQARPPVAATRTTTCVSGEETSWPAWGSTRLKPSKSPRATKTRKSPPAEYLLRLMRVEWTAESDPAEVK